jgi:PIN domain nuclease of toxin-antitoxin system
VRVLLDTHALLWWLSGDGALTPAARATIGDAGNEVFVSAATAWEIATKHRIWKLPGAGPLAVDFAREIESQGFLPLPITLSHGQDAGALSLAQRDPFDRMLVAQALAERMVLVSNETSFDAAGVVRVW